jgi:hypothetical protein
MAISTRSRKTATVVAARGNEMELKIDHGHTIIVDLSRISPSARWTVLQPETLEVRSGDKLLPGKTVKLVTAAGIKASEVISARGFVVPICGNVRCGWVMPQYTLDKTAKVAVVGATNRVELCRHRTAAKPKGGCSSPARIAGSPVHFPLPSALGQDSAAPHRAVLDSVSGAGQGLRCGAAKTARKHQKTPISTRKSGQGQER